MCAKIDELYAKNGFFLARAYPPPQEMKEGILTIEVIEGKLGKISIEGNRYYTESFIRSYFASLLGKTLCDKEFMRALLLLNENTDLSAGAVFEKGEEFGTADVILQVYDRRPLHLYYNGNNYGRNLTTNIRAGGRLDWGNLIFQGDTFSVAEVVGFPMNALYFTDVTYTVPLNRIGTSMELAYLYSNFKIEEETSLHLRACLKSFKNFLNHV
jgi:hemolysin activation/secretion protein